MQYTIRSGDTLSRIAATHGTTLRALLDAGCDRVLALASTGSLRADWPVGTVVVPDDFFAPWVTPSIFDDTRGHAVPGFDPEWRRVFMPGNRPPSPGELFVQADLAHTLRDLAAEGPDLFYRGRVARAIADRLAAEGFVTADDLARHTGEWGEPVSTTYRGVTVYDDFAHHPTAIELTLAGLRAKVNGARIIAVLEPRSNTMKLGVMKDELAGSLATADRVYCYGAGLGWDVRAVLAPLGAKARVCDEFERLLREVADDARAGDHVVIMSNGGFGGIHEKLLAALGRR